jgi:hypothetical protein
MDEVSMVTPSLVTPTCDSAFPQLTLFFFNYLKFLTLRRLNIRIQGLPESYATEPYMGESMVIGEPHPLTGPPPMSDNMTQMMLTDEVDPVPSSSDPMTSDLAGRDPPPSSEHHTDAALDGVPEMVDTGVGEGSVKGDGPVSDGIEIQITV